MEGLPSLTPPSFPLSVPLKEETSPQWKRTRVNHKNNPGAPCWVITSHHPEDWQLGIQTHMQMGLNAFRNLLLLYHRTQAQVEIERTSYQIGLSEEESGSAAHYCILPNVKDNYFVRFWSRAEQGSLLQVEQECFDKLKYGGDLKPLEKKVHTLAQQQLSLCHLHEWMYSLMNSTVIGPAIMNQVDGVLESRGLRELALEILNDVARDKSHPDDGFYRYFQNLHHLLVKSKQETETAIDLLIEVKALLGQLHTSGDGVAFHDEDVEHHLEKRFEIEGKLDEIKILDLVVKKKFPSRPFLETPNFYIAFRVLKSFSDVDDYKNLYLNLVRMMKQSDIHFESLPSFKSDSECDFDLDQEALFHPESRPSETWVEASPSFLEEEDSRETSIDYQAWCEKILSSHSMVELALASRPPQERVLLEPSHFHIPSSSLQKIEGYLNQLVSSLTVLNGRLDLIEAFQHCPLRILGDYGGSGREEWEIASWKRHEGRLFQECWERVLSPSFLS